MTNEKLIALLREARESVVALADEYESLMLATETEEKQRELARRIDAALAEADAALKIDMPEWTLWNRLWDDSIIWKIRDFCQGVTLSVKPSRPAWGFYWSVKQFGQKPTEDEAKAAAVECARRLP